MKKFKIDLGFTLIELLAVMVVMITVGLIVATILVSSLRGTNKTNTINNIRQNGNYAMLQMSKMIEFAQSFVGVSSDGVSYKTDCSIIPSPQYKYIKITSFDGGQPIFSCGTNPATIASKGASLIDTANVDVPSCYFTCTRNNVSQAPVIGIYFTLTQKSSSSFFEKQAKIDFENSVVIRNLNK